MRPARVGERVILASGDIYLIENIPGFGIFPEVSLNCEVCFADRIRDQKMDLQNVSRLTDMEREYRLHLVDVVDRPDTSKMIEAVSEVTNNNASMLTIWGRHGNAKSVTLIAAVNEFLEKGIPAVYAPAWDVLNWIMDAFSKDGAVISRSAYERIELFKNIPVMALDEFQAFKVTDWKLEQVRNIIDRRWRDGIDGKSKTLIAMNESPEGLEDRLLTRLRDGRNRPCPAGQTPQPIIYNGDSDMRPLMRRTA